MVFIAVSVVLVISIQEFKWLTAVSVGEVITFLSRFANYNKHMAGCCAGGV